MPEPFKSVFNAGLVAAMAAHLGRHALGFDAAGFAAMAADGLEALELKARAAQITRALDACLPAEFDAACDLMLAALHPDREPPPAIAETDGAGLRGWAVMPMADLVALRGAGHLERSLDVLAEMTKRFSAEFAVRPFLAAEPERAMARFMTWTGDANLHVRRLASEGSRPRLPWGMRLGGFVADPAPLVPLLARLRDDPAEYVRRSVANSLNDIAKDHPNLVAGIARGWLADAPPERVRLVRHACRTLVKQGHPATLAALGYRPAEVAAGPLIVATPEVRFGAALVFRLELRSTAAAAQTLVLDYAIHHRKANGGTSPKVFKWRRIDLAPGAALALERRHPVRPITTRSYHDGAHRIEVQVNGAVVASGGFHLTGAPGVSRPRRARAGA